MISFEESTYSSVEGEDGVEVCLRVPGGRGTRRGLFTTESGTATGKPKVLSSTILILP